MTELPGRSGGAFQTLFTTRLNPSRFDDFFDFGTIDFGTLADRFGQRPITIIDYTAPLKVSTRVSPWPLLEGRHLPTEPTELPFDVFEWISETSDVGSDKYERIWNGCQLLYQLSQLPSFSTEALDEALANLKTILSYYREMESIPAPPEPETLPGNVVRLIENNAS